MHGARVHRVHGECVRCWCQGAGAKVLVHGAKARRAHWSARGLGPASWSPEPAPSNPYAICPVQSRQHRRRRHDRTAARTVHLAPSGRPAAAARARVHHCHSADARPRHRLVHRDLHGGLRRPAPAAAVSRAGSDRPPLAGQRERRHTRTSPTRTTRTSAMRRAASARWRSTRIGRSRSLAVPRRCARGVPASRPASSTSSASSRRSAAASSRRSNGLGGAPAAIVSHGFWQQALGATRDSRRTHPDLRRPQLHRRRRDAAIVSPIPLAWTCGPHASSTSELPSRTAHNWSVIGRLGDNVTLARARDEAHAIAARLKAQHGEETWMFDAAVLPLRDELVGKTRPVLLMLLGAVAFLLLVASANVVNLLLARAASRQREAAVRAALGAVGARGRSCRSSPSRCCSSRPDVRSGSPSRPSASARS